MGVSGSMEKRRDDFVDAIETEIQRRMMVQREVQIAINIAKARDNIQIFGSIWLTYATALTFATLSKRPFPPLSVIPLVVGGIMLGNMADMAYGNKVARINKEVAYLLEHERARFVPFPESPLAKFYSKEQRATLYDKATASGDLAPFSVICRSYTPKSD